MEAAAEGHSDVVQLLVDREASLDMQDSTGDTALIHAVIYQRLEPTHILLDYGANIDLVTQYGLTALGWAWISGYHKHIQLILERHPTVWRTQLDAWGFVANFPEEFQVYH